MPRPFTADEEELAALLARTGLSRAAARSLVALLRAAAGAADVAAVAGLARQDVSDATRELEARGLVRIEKIVGERGGRPALRYHLARDAATAARALVAQRRKALADEAEALDALERRFG